MTGTEKVAETSREKILKTAVAEIHRNGFRSTGINDILCKTGLTKGAFYYHFKSKADFGLAVVKEMFDSSVKEIWIRPLEKPDAGINSLQQTIEYAMAASNEHFAALGCPLCNLASEMANQDDNICKAVTQFMDYWRNQIFKVLSYDQDKGVIRKDVDCERSAYFVLSSLQGAITMAKPYKSPAPFRAALRGLQDYLQSLKVSPSNVQLTH